MKSQFSLILASSSSARKMLFARLNLPFETISPNIDETPLPNESPEVLVARLTKAKGEAVSRVTIRGITQKNLIISSDQVIVVNGQAISKPETKAAAIQQLQSESGKTVEALTGLGLLNAESGHYQYVCVKTQVKFQTLTLAQIEQYLANDPQAMHCAGSLRVEALGISLLEKVESEDPTALIGLPLIALTKMLRKENISI